MIGHFCNKFISKQSGSYFQGANTAPNSLFSVMISMRFKIFGSFIIVNDRGWVLGGAYATERIMPGAVYQDHGARLDPITAGE